MTFTSLGVIALPHALSMSMPAAWIRTFSSADFRAFWSTSTASLDASLAIRAFRASGIFGRPPGLPDWLGWKGLPLTGFVMSVIIQHLSAGQKH